MREDHNKQKKIALVNDLTGFGRRSVAVQLPVISQLGVQCCVLPTSILSNHTGFSSYSFQYFTPFIFGCKGLFMDKSMNVLYRVHDGLYVNLTNRCSCNCSFCLRNEADGAHGSDTLWLEREPNAQEVIAALESMDLSPYSEFVFCGYGEPTEAFDVLKEVARWVKENTSLPVRINTNGQGSLICGRDIAPELEGLVDELSVSLNTPDAQDYLAITRSRFGEQAFDGMLEFVRRAKKYVPAITLTTVGSTITPDQELRCARICEDLGVDYRIRPLV